MSIAESIEEEIENQPLEDSLKLTKTKHEPNLIKGDFNAKIKQGIVENVVGRCDFGMRNERERLIQCCQETDMVVTNTFFKLHPRRFFIWQAPGDTPKRIMWNRN